MDTSVAGVVKRRVRAVFGTENLEGLFKMKKLAYSTSLLVILRGEFHSLLISYASWHIHRIDRIGAPSVSPSHILQVVRLCNPLNVRYTAFVAYQYASLFLLY